MILTVDELKTLIETTEPDSILEMKLQALENMVREYTHWIIWVDSKISKPCGNCTKLFH